MKIIEFNGIKITDYELICPITKTAFRETTYAQIIKNDLCRFGRVVHMPFAVSHCSGCGKYHTNYEIFTTDCLRLKQTKTE